MIIAIDGPAGAGKSTVATRVAERLGFELINTGALYRAVAWVAHGRGVSWADEGALTVIARDLDVRFVTRGGAGRVLVDGVDCTVALRAPLVSEGASRVSALPGVRAGLLDLQRSFARTRDVVMEGRDIGTVIFPTAEVKVFLTATTAERARRRQAEYAALGAVRSLAEVVEEIERRDQRDVERDAAPLRQADDAVRIDATAWTVDEVVDRIAALAAEAGA